MLTEKQIKKEAGANSYFKGLDLYHSGKVLDFDMICREDGIADIEAVVKGSGRNKYVVSMVYDELADELLESYCECPAFYSYAGICKHCVAVLLTYAEKQNDTENQLGQLSLFPNQSKPAGMWKTAQKSTTPEIRELLGRQVVKSAFPLMQKDIYQKVRLEPFLTCEAGNISVEFKIGVSNMYVLKNVFEFERNMHTGARFSYGKKLEFIHIPEAFEDKSRKLLEFILYWVRANAGRFLQYSYVRYGYQQSYAKLRSLPLSGKELEEFLETVGEEPFTANVNRTGERLWRVTDAPVKRLLKITGQEDGVEISVNALFGFRCSKYNIYFEDGLVYRDSLEKTEEIRDFLSCMSGIASRKAYIQRDEVAVFCRELLPALEKVYTCEKIKFDEADYGVVPVSFEIYLDAPQKDFVTCKLLALYGEEKYNVYDKQDSMAGRDIVKEMQAGTAVSSFCNAFDENEKVMVLADDEEKLYEFLSSGIYELQKIGKVFISDALKRINIMQAPKTVLGISLSGDLLELRFTSEDMPREELIEILSKYNKRKKHFRLKNGSFVDTEDESLQTLLEIKQTLNLTESQLKKGTVEVPKYRAVYLDSELRERQGFSAVKDKAFKQLARNMKTIEDNDFEIPASLETILREYQKRGFLWLKAMRNNGFGGILADDMGLGKTLQVITFLLSEFLEAKASDNRKCLIVTPASLVYNWNSEIERFAPALPIKMVTGSADQRRQMIQESQDRDILITSYDLLRRDSRIYEGIPFFCQIIDEAQYIKNNNTQAAKAVKQIQAASRFALTGTPIENRLSELWSIFDYLMPGFLYSYQRFRDEMETPVVQNQDEMAMKRLQKMIRPFILRRLKKDVLTDLPDKLEENVFAKPEGEQQKLYDAHVKRMKLMLDKQSDEEFKSTKIQILSELTRLRQLCCDPALLYEDYQEPSAKADMCIDLIKNAVSAGHKILLFSQFTSMLERLQERLKQEGISFYTLTGATAKEKRIKLVETFNQDETNVFCISLKAGGTGLNLTAADIVIHFDPWWNLAVQNQATDRAHRIGQKNVVTVYKLIMKGTIEENIVKLQEKKKELAEQVLSGEGLNTGSFTKEELLELLG